MPEGPETLAAQVRDLAARIGALEQGRDRSAERPAILGRARNPRLAITCKKDTGTDYPDISDEPNTYYVKFLDSTYTETEGKQTATHTERQAEGRFLAHVPNGTLFLPRDTIVETFHDNGRWWVSPPVNGDIYFELKDALAPGGYADAYPLTYSGGYAVDTGQYFRVHDAFNRFRGRARVASPALQGSRGKCRWNTLSKRFDRLAPAACDDDPGPGERSERRVHQRLDLCRRQRNDHAATRHGTVHEHRWSGAYLGKQQRRRRTRQQCSRDFGLERRERRLGHLGRTMSGMNSTPELWLPGDPLELRPAPRDRRRVSSWREYGYGYPCCCFDGVCGFCSGSTPEKLELVISGAANDSCDECYYSAGTFVCTFQEGGCGFLTCCWDSPTFEPCDNHATPVCRRTYWWRVGILQVSGTELEIRVGLAGAATPHDIVFKKTVTPLSISCDFEDLDIPWVSDPPNCNPCNYNGETATLSAL